MSAAGRILVVEDDPDIARLVQAQLERDGFEITINASGRGVVDQVEALRPRLLILDLMLPHAHGLDIVRALRENPASTQLPIVVLTALGAEADRIRGLDLGADDYLAKPFSPAELAARVRARLRAEPAAARVLTAGPFALDARARQARREGRLLELSGAEFRLLAFFLGAPGRALTRAEIIAGVWSPRHFITDRAVDVLVRRLRAKIEADPELPEFIVSVRGVGYRFDASA